MCKHRFAYPNSTPLRSLTIYVQNRYVQRQTGARIERRQGRCSDLSARRAHPAKVGVTLATFLMTITARSSDTRQECCTIYCTHKDISTALLPLCGRYFLSLAYRHL